MSPQGFLLPCPLLQPSSDLWLEGAAAGLSACLKAENYNSLLTGDASKFGERERGAGERRILKGEKGTWKEKELPRASCVGCSRPC